MNFRSLLKIKKLSLAVSALLLGSDIVNAQQPTTAAAYPFEASAKTYVPIATTGPALTGGSQDDGYINNISLGFPFTFAGVSYTTVTMCTNGWLAFGNSTATVWTNDLANAASFQPGVFAWWDDHYMSVSSGNSSYNQQMNYTTTGSAGSRVFTAQWYAVDPRLSYVYALSWQVKLYEDGGIEFLYKHEIPGGGSWTGGASVGIVKSASDYQTIPTSGVAPVPSASTFTSTISTAPANGQSYYWGVQKKGFNNGAVAGVMAPKPPFCPGNQPIVVSLKNAGKNRINSVTVGWSVDGVPQTPYTYSSMIDTNGSGAGNLATATIGSVVFGNAPRTLKVYTSNPNGIADTVNADDTVEITLRASPLARITTTDPLSYCGGGIVNTVLKAQTGTNYTYRWKLNGAFIVPPATGANYTASAPGDYTVQVDSNACSIESPVIRIEQLAMPMPSVTPSTRADFCTNDSIQIQANANIAGATYQWLFNGQIMPGESNASLYAKSQGNYNVITKKGSCVATSAGVNVLEVQPPVPVVTESGNSLVTQSTFKSYQWKEDGIDITGATEWYFVPNHPGKYSVLVSNGGCTGLSPEFFTTLTVNNIAGNTVINIYPNPAKDVLHISPFLNLNASVYSVEGRLMIKEMHAKTVNVTTLPKGVYIIKLTDDDGNLVKTQKLGKE